MSNQRKSVLMFLSQDKFFLSHFAPWAHRLIKDGWSVTVLAKATSAQAVRKIDEYGCSFIDSGIDRAGTGLFIEIKSILRVLKILKTEKPTVIHNFGAKSIIYGTIASKLQDKTRPVINNLTGLGIVYCKNTLKYRLIKVLMDFLYRLYLNPKNSLVICENRDDIKYFFEKRALDLHSVRLVPGAGVDTVAFQPLPWNKRNARITVVMCSRLLRSKGVWIYIEAARIIKKRGINVSFQLVGDIDLENPDSLGNSDLDYIKNMDYIKYLGFSTNVQEILKLAHICVLPSHREGFPKSLAEGAASGLAIVTTDVPGCRDVVGNKNGLIVPVNDAKGLADSIEYLVKNPELTCQMGVNSRSLAESKLGSEVICEIIAKVYEELINTTPGARIGS